MHDSFTPLGGLVPLINMQLGEVMFGGVGTGLYSMLIFAIVGVFIAGLMIGRTPEYLGKKIEYDQTQTPWRRITDYSKIIKACPAWQLDNLGLSEGQGNDYLCGYDGMANYTIRYFISRRACPAFPCS